MMVAQDGNSILIKPNIGKGVDEEGNNLFIHNKCKFTFSSCSTSGYDRTSCIHKYILSSLILNKQCSHSCNALLQSQIFQNSTMTNSLCVFCWFFLDKWHQGLDAVLSITTTNVCLWSRITPCVKLFWGSLTGSVLFCSDLLL